MLTAQWLMYLMCSHSIMHIRLEGNIELWVKKYVKELHR